jgi:hypothetical protein
MLNRVSSFCTSLADMPHALNVSRCGGITPYPLASGRSWQMALDSFFPLLCNQLHLLPVDTVADALVEIRVARVISATDKRVHIDGVDFTGFPCTVLIAAESPDLFAPSDLLFLHNATVAFLVVSVPHHPTPSPTHCSQKETGTKIFVTSQCSDVFVQSPDELLFDGKMNGLEYLTHLRTQHAERVVIKKEH